MEKEIDRFIEYLKYQRNYSDFTCNNYKKDLNEYNSFILSNKINYKNESNFRFIFYCNYIAIIFHRIVNDLLTIIEIIK